MVESVKTTEFVIRDLETLRVVSDPLRVRILEAASGVEPASVKEIGARLGVAPGKLYYHVELLERAGLLQVAGTRIVSGITEKRYRCAAQAIRVDRRVLTPGESFEALDAILSAVLDATRTEAERSARAGVLSIDAPDDPTASGLFSRTHVRLDEERAAEFQRKLGVLIDEYRESDDAARTAYGLTIAFFPVASGD